MESSMNPDKLEALEKAELAQYTKMTFSRIHDTITFYSGSLLRLKFSYRIQDTDIRTACFEFVLWDLWERYKKGDMIDRDVVEAELAKRIGLARCEEEISKSLQEFEEFCSKVYDFLEEADKQYYSGFIGKCVAKWEALKGQKRQRRIYRF